MRRRLTSAGWWLAAALVAAPAHAAVVEYAEVAEPGRVRWRAPEGCPDLDAIERRLADALGEQGAQLEVDAAVESSGDGTYRATVVLRGQWGETSRVLDSPTCETLVDAVVLLAQVSVEQAEEAGTVVVPDPGTQTKPEPEPAPEAADGSSDASQTDDEAGPAATTEPELESDPPVSPELTDPRDLTVARADKEGTAASEPVVRGLARAEVRVGGGVLPGVDAGAAVAVGLAHRWFRVELLGAAWLPRDRTIAPNAQLDLQLFTGQLRGCAVVPVPSLPWLEPLPCAGIEVGAMRGQGQGQGLEQGRVALQPWVAVTVTPALAIMPWRRLGFIVGGTLVVPVQRPTFVLSGTQEVYRVSAAAGRGFAGVELRFP